MWSSTSIGMDWEDLICNSREVGDRFKSCYQSVAQRFTQEECLPWGGLEPLKGVGRLEKGGKGIGRGDTSEVLVCKRTWLVV